MLGSSGASFARLDDELGAAIGGGADGAALGDGLLGAAEVLRSSQPVDCNRAARNFSTNWAALMT